MRIVILGAVLAIIAPFVFHLLLQTELRMRSIVLIMGGILLVSIIPAINYQAVNDFINHLPKGLLVKSVLIAAVILLGVWQFFKCRNKSNKINKNNKRNEINQKGPNG